MVWNDESIGAGASNIRSDRAYRIHDRRVALESIATLVDARHVHWSCG